MVGEEGEREGRGEGRGEGGEGEDARQNVCIKHRGNATKEAGQEGGRKRRRREGEEGWGTAMMTITCTVLVRVRVRLRASVQQREKRKVKRSRAMSPSRWVVYKPRLSILALLVEPKCSSFFFFFLNVAVNISFLSFFFLFTPPSSLRFVVQDNWLEQKTGHHIKR